MVCIKELITLQDRTHKFYIAQIKSKKNAFICDCNRAVKRCLWNCAIANMNFCQSSSTQQVRVAVLWRNIMSLSFSVQNSYKNIHTDLSQLSIKFKQPWRNFVKINCSFSYLHLLTFPQWTANPLELDIMYTQLLLLERMLLILWTQQAVTNSSYTTISWF